MVKYEKIAIFDQYLYFGYDTSYFRTPLGTRMGYIEFRMTLGDLYSMTRSTARPLRQLSYLFCFILHYPIYVDFYE